jgi:hypothetical protein
MQCFNGNSERKNLALPSLYAVWSRCRNATDYPLTIQLCQVGVLYHDLVLPGDVFHRETGAVHFTVRARINNTGADDTNILGEAVVPVVGATSIGVISTFSGPFVAAGTILVGGGLLLANSQWRAEITSRGWYAGKRHELEIGCKENKTFFIVDKKTNEVYT